MRNIALLLRYDGGNFHGWQSQENAVAIQDVLSGAIESLTGAKPYPRLEGCGRTDAGVHALGYVASFHTESRIPPERMPYALKPLLPEAISVRRGAYVSDEFHARFSVVKKRYKYIFYSANTPDPFLLGRAYFSPVELDAAAMDAAARLLEGYHDFAAFRAAGSNVRTSDRTIYECRVRETDGRIELSVAADGFLYNMVRIIAGTLYYVGIGKLAPGDITAILESRERVEAGVTLPPHGLYLDRVWYPAELSPWPDTAAELESGEVSACPDAETRESGI